MTPPSILSHAQRMANLTNTTWGVWQDPDTGEWGALEAVHFCCPKDCPDWVEPDNQWHRRVA